MSRGATKDLVRGGGIVAVGFALIAALAVVFGNGTTDPVTDRPDGLSCRVEAAGVPLPLEVRETSGLARSSRNPDVFWTHNDSGDGPILYAIGVDGGLAAMVQVEGARARDWEDLAAAPCPGGDGGCLYIADTGDNDAERDEITVYVVPEPGPGQATVPSTALRARYPEGPRDAEGIFVADGRIHLVTKGREGPIRLYRFPGGAAAGAVSTLEPVAEIAPRPDGTADYVTAATASPDGRWIAIRTYRTLVLLEAGPLLAGRPGPGRAFDLRPLEERQGESLVLGDAGEVWTTSEGDGREPSWSRLVCDLSEAAPGNGS